MKILISHKFYLERSFKLQTKERITHQDTLVQHEIFVFSVTLFICITYLLTPWSRALLEKLTGLQLVKKFPAFYGTRRFITAFTSARHLFLSWASSIQSILPTFHFLNINLNIILPSKPGSPPEVSFSQVSPAKPCIHLSFSHMCYMPRPSHSSRCYHSHNIGWAVQIILLLIM